MVGFVPKTAIEYRVSAIVTELERDGFGNSLTRARVVSLNAGNRGDQGRRTLVLESEVIAVRPDGYVGFRGPPGKKDDFLKYAGQDGIQ
jgi:hypothetical protein